MNNQEELNQYFRFRCEKGMKWRGLANKKEYEERLKHEFDVITTMNFAGYFLIICDLLDWCRENKIPLGTGRGSGGGSLITYCLNITQLDPIRYGLIFERFLDYTRTDSYPDLDLDFGKNERYLVLEYLAEKFGSPCVAGIGTYGTMKTKGAIRAVCRSLGHAYDIGDELAKLTLPPISGKEQKLETCYEKVPALAAARNGGLGPERQEILKAAEWMEGRLQNFGQHASGYVIADFPISQVAPLTRGKEDFPVCQIDMNDLEELGLIKFDILGLKTLSIMETCLQLVEQRHGTRLDPLEFPLDDEKTFDLICSGDVLGLFQLTGSSGLQSLTTKLHPRSLEDISLLCAIYRPGPLASGMVDQVVEVRNGRQEAEYFLPELQPILEETAGCVVYQEQLMQIARDLAGYSMVETNKLRKATAKKKKKLMDEQKEKFTSGMVESGFAGQKAEDLFKSLEEFSSYSFNRSHSALYGYISFQTAYLKAYYPLEFVCACLIHESDNAEEVYKYLAWCKKHDIPILPPDINESAETFSIAKDNGIRFGLGVIKNVGVSAMKKVVEARSKKGSFANIIDFCDRCPTLNRKMLQSLIMAGAFDSLHSDRQMVIDGVEDIWRYRQDVKRYKNKLKTYNKKMKDCQEREELRAWGIKKPSLKKPTAPKRARPPVLLPSLHTLSNIDLYQQEMDLLGYYLTGHPVDLVANRPNRVASSIAEMKENAENDGKASILAVPTLIKETTTRKTKQKMAYITVEDGTDTLDLTIFAKTWAKYKKDIKLGQPAVFIMNLEVLKSKGEDDTADTVADSIVKGKAFAVKSVELRKINIDTEIPLFKATLNELWEKEKQLKKLLKKGKTPVRFRVSTHNKTIEFILNLQTNSVPLLQRLFQEAK